MSGGGGLRIERGEPTPEEFAALVVVLSRALTAEPEPSAGSDGPRGGRAATRRRRPPPGSLPAGRATGATGWRQG